MKVLAAIRDCDTCFRMFEEIPSAPIPEMCPFCGSLESQFAVELERTYRKEENCGEATRDTIQGKGNKGSSTAKKTRRKNLAN